MRAVLQRVKNAKVSVDGEICGEIDEGVFVLLGICKTDDKDVAEKLARKMSRLRIFPDKTDKMNLSVLDKKFSILVVSQFTLIADTEKGNRPSFTKAMPAEKAKDLYEYFCLFLKEMGLNVQTGRFGAHMDILADLDGPVTIIINSTD